LTPNPTIPTFAFDTVCRPWADELGWTGEFSVTSLHPFKNEQHMDYSKCLYDPFDKQTVSKLEGFPEFQFEVKDKAKVIAYLILVYDRNSDLFLMHSDNLYMRKKEAALRVGFKLDVKKHFEEWVEQILTGENEQFNLAQFRYVRFHGIPDLPVLIKYLEMLDAEMAGVLPSDPLKRKYVMTNIEELHKKIDDYEQKIFTGKESERARESLYSLIEKIRVPRPEYIAQDIASKSLDLPDPHGFQQ
jgi:hypothetical protein